MLSGKSLFFLRPNSACHAGVLHGIIIRKKSCARFVPFGCVTSWFVVEGSNGCQMGSARFYLLLVWCRRFPNPQVASSILAGGTK